MVRAYPTASLRAILLVPDWRFSYIACSQKMINRFVHPDSEQKSHCWSARKYESAVYKQGPIKRQKSDIKSKSKSHVVDRSPSLIVTALHFLSNMLAWFRLSHICKGNQQGMVNSFTMHCEIEAKQINWSHMSPSLHLCDLCLCWIMKNHTPTQMTHRPNTKKSMRLCFYVFWNAPIIYKHFPNNFHFIHCQNQFSPV